MNNKALKHISRRTTVSAALCLAIGLSMTSTTASAAHSTLTGTSVFDMYAPGGALMNKDSGVTATYNATNSSWGVTSPNLFSGLPWTASGGILYTTSGTYTISTADTASSSGCRSGLTPVGGPDLNFTVGSGQIGGAIKFAWGSTCGIDVVNVWDVSYGTTGIMMLTSTDVNGDGTLGRAMIDGPFPGFSANFPMTLQPAFSLALAATQAGSTVSTMDRGSIGNVTVDSGLGAGYTFDWSSNTSAAVQAVQTGGLTNSTLVFTPDTLTANTKYTISVTATRVSDSETVRADIDLTSSSITLSSSDDTDGDGVADKTEGFGDSNGNGLEDFLDDSNLTTKQLRTAANDTSSRLLTTDSGVLSMGNTAIAVKNGKTALSDFAVGPVVTASDIGGSDGDVNTSCVGGCYDFKVTGLSNGGVAKVVIPLSSAIPDFPVYRKYSTANGSWGGFRMDDNNSISSAAALSTGPVTCPAAGSSAYSTVGLTPGDYCIQLTLQDGGSTDADGVVNGTIVDPGGVAASKEKILNANVPSGCSMSTVPVDPSQRADWWLVAGFFAALGWLRAIRRKAHVA